jgi:hypothetical protein
VFGLGGGTPPLPLPASGSPFTVTFVGRRLLLVTDIQGWPGAAAATIRQRTDCYLTVELRLPRGSREGTQGQGTLRVGQAAGPRFTWTVGPVPPRRSAGPAVVIGGGGAGAVAGDRGTPAMPPDLVPTFTGTVFRFTQPGSRRVSDQFCQSLPIPPAGQVSIGEVTVGRFSWGVINSSNAAVTTPFRIELRNNATNQVLQASDVPPDTLRPGNQTSQLTYMRPQSRTMVVRVTPTTSVALRNTYGGGSTGCFQAPMPPNSSLNWQDPSFQIRVDTANAVDEGAGGEINNTGVY